MSITSKLTARNQTTIPKAVVAALRIRPSSLLLYEIEPDGRVLLSAKSATFAEFAESFPDKRPRKSVSNEELNAAVREGAIRRYRKPQP